MLDELKVIAGAALAWIGLLLMALAYIFGGEGA